SRCTWFPNAPRVEYIDEARLRLTDFLVAPEVLGPTLNEIGKGLPTVIYNQNAYNTFRHYSLDLSDTTTAYRSPQVVGCIAVSEDNRQYLEYAFPGLNVRRLHYSID